MGRDFIQTIASGSFNGAQYGGAMQRFEFLSIYFSTRKEGVHSSWSDWTIQSLLDDFDTTGTRREVLERVSNEGWELRSTERDPRHSVVEEWFDFQRRLD
jgi:hypothetical protein